MTPVRIALSLLSAGMLALPVTPAAAEDLEIGAQLYRNYCASCHGDDGRGAGPVAPFLTVEVPPLTGIAAAHDGVFPMLDIIHIIDGRTGVRGHGDASGMPVWGSVFSEGVQTRMGYYGSVIEARGRVMSLAMYLASLQE